MMVLTTHASVHTFDGQAPAATLLTACVAASGCQSTLHSFCKWQCTWQYMAVAWGYWHIVVAVHCSTCADPGCAQAVRAYCEGVRACRLQHSASSAPQHTEQVCRGAVGQADRLARLPPKACCGPGCQPARWPGVKGGGPVAAGRSGSAGHACLSLLPSVFYSPQKSLHRASCSRCARLCLPEAHPHM
jgi:hypothetical protein